MSSLRRRLTIASMSAVLAVALAVPTATAKRPVKLADSGLTIRTAETRTSRKAGGPAEPTAAASANVKRQAKGKATKRGKGKRPNVVTIMTDDQDFRSMWAMPKTRRLIGARGTTFKQSVVNFPLCCPSRATYYTGQYAHNHGVLWNNWPEGGFYKLDGSETLPVWLRRAGYRTIHVGKYLNEYGERDPRQVPRGWDDWYGGVDPSTYAYFGFTINHNGELRRYDGPSNYSVDVHARLATRAVRKAKRAGKPFFLDVSPLAPHTVADDVKARIEGTPAVPPPRYEGRFADAPLPRYPNFDEADISDKPTTLAEYFPTLLTEDQIDSLTEHYRGRMGSLLAVDDMVARVVKALKRAGVYRNTVIVFTSDNGWALGEHRLRDPVTSNGRAAGVKYVSFEGSSRVPLLIAGPGFPARRKVQGITVNADLAATIGAIAGARSTLPRDGISLRRAARRPSVLKNRGVLIETATNPRDVPPYVAIRTKRYRYDLQADGQEGLYDLKLDPWELDSVHDDSRYARIKAILARRLAVLKDCRGTDCKAALSPLPKPG